MIKGQPMSEEAKIKSSLSHKGRRLSMSTEFKKGHIPWLKGKTRKEDARIPQPWLGKKLPLEMVEKRKKSFPDMKGSKSVNWKGGITTQDKLDRVKFRRTIQKQVFERDDYTCTFCGTRGVDLQVDHIQSWKDFVELRFNIENCRTLCIKCHYKITFGREMPTYIKTWGHNLKQMERRLS